MAKKPSTTPPKPIGERLRNRRVDVLKKGLREMARDLDTAPAHLTDIENGRRSPSEDLLVKLAAAYSMDESELRAGFGKPESDVKGLASASPTAAMKVPELLRTASGMSAEQYDRLIKLAKKMKSDEREEPKR